jgi:4'-phosphopantetheinyl transferase
MEIQEQLWLPPPTNLNLTNHEVHVWRAALDLASSQVKHLRGILTTDELDRAERFHFDKDRRYFIAGRGLLRTILSRYLSVPPENLRFCYNSYGKPSLAPEFDHHRLNFNLSHSDGLALYAITRNREIGIDLERIRTNIEYEELAKRFFSPREVAVFRTIPAEMKARTFFSCWTRKEAYIKAQGQGLSIPLDSFDVSLVPGKPAMLLTVRNKPREVSHWTLQDLKLGDGFVGTIAVRTRNRKLRLCH